MDDEGGPIHAISPDSANTVRYVLYSAPIGEGGGNSGPRRNAGGWDSPKVAGSGVTQCCDWPGRVFLHARLRRFRSVTYQYAVYFICPLFTYYDTE